MSESSNEKITNEQGGSKKEWNFEAEQNWLGFWSLLLQEDRKQNPHLYKKPKEYEDNGNTNNTG